MISSNRAAALLGAALAVVLAPQAAPAQGFTPQNPECIAPADPGGGWDFTCRTVGKLLTDEGILDDQVQVVNMAGGVGAVAFANVTGKRNDDTDLFVATSTVGITQIAQGLYPADETAVRWLAMLGADVGAVLVGPDSEHGDLESLLGAMAEDPTSIVAGGSSSIGGWDHLRLLLLARAAGVSDEDLQKIRWVQYSGGSEAVTQLLGGFIDVVLTDIGEIAGFIESGDATPLAVMADERLDAFGDIPTAIEAGYEETGYNWRGFYLPGEVSDEAYDFWLQSMQTLYDTEAWQEEATAKGLTPIFRGGEEFEAFVKQSKDDMEQISRAIGVIE